MLLCKYCNAPGACDEYCFGMDYQGREDFDETDETTKEDFDETDETTKGETK